MVLARASVCVVEQVPKNDCCQYLCPHSGYLLSLQKVLLDKQVVLTQFSPLQFSPVQFSPEWVHILHPVGHCQNNKK